MYKIKLNKLLSLLLACFLVLGTIPAGVFANDSYYGSLCDDRMAVEIGYVYEESNKESEAGEDGERRPTDDETVAEESETINDETEEAEESEIIENETLEYEEETTTAEDETNIPDLDLMSGTVKFDFQGGHVNGEPNYSTTVFSGQHLGDILPTEPIKEDYMFKGWAAEPYGDVVNPWEYTFEAGMFVQGAASVFTFYAVWGVGEALAFSPFAVAFAYNRETLYSAINDSAITEIFITASFSINSLALNIPAGRNIRIVSDSSVPGAPFTLTQTQVNARHFTVDGTLILEDITLYGGTGTSFRGGIQVNDNGRLYLQNGGRIIDNRAANGGGVNIAGGGLFTMNGGEISGNTTNGSGGGVYVAAGGTFNMNNTSNISGNHSSVSGGGVFTAGLFNMSNGLISENTAGSVATGSGGGVAVSGYGSFTQSNGIIEYNAAGSRGGGVAVMTVTAQFTCVRGEIRGNGQSRTVTPHTGADVSINVTHSGGGISSYVSGTGHQRPSGAIVLGSASDSTAIPLITENSAWNGGGIAVISAPLTVYNAVIHGNTATAASGNGGGIMVRDSVAGSWRGPRSTVIIHNITVTGNTAPGSTSQGGGMYFDRADVTMRTGQIGGGAPGEGNTASGAGGGISMWDTEFIMHDGAISGNTVTNTAPTHNAAGIGGGVHVGQLSFFTKNGGIIGGFTPAEANRAHSGAGMWIAGDWWATVTLNDGALIHGNIASNRAGGVGGWFGTTLVMNGGRISGNQAPTGGGVYLFTDIAPTDASRIPRFYMYGGIIGGNEPHQANRATNGAGVGLWNAEFLMRGNGQILGNIATGRGGGVDINRNATGVHVTGGRFFMEGDSRIAGNTANTNGGGVHLGVEANTHTATLTMSGNSEIYNNTANNGGGIHLAAGSVTQNGGTISGNTATQNGGGVNMTRGSLTLGSGIISDNIATNGNGGGVNVNGGGIHQSGSSIHWLTGELTPGSIISGNTAGNNGGGVNLGSGSMFTWGVVSGNTASNNGGGVNVGTGASLTIDGGIIGGSTSEDANRAVNGGGISVANGGGVWIGVWTYFDNGIPVCEIRGNIASGNGGGIYFSSNFSELYMAGGTIADNIANNGGGIFVYHDNESQITGQSSFTIYPLSTFANNSARNGISVNTPLALANPQVNPGTVTLSAFNLVEDDGTGNFDYTTAHAFTNYDINATGTQFWQVTRLVGQGQGDVIAKVGDNDFLITGHFVPHNTEVRFVACPAANYKFRDWEIDTRTALGDAEFAPVFNGGTEEISRTITAHTRATGNFTGSQHPVIFDLNGGNIDGNTANIIREVNDGDNVGNVTSPSSETKTFAGWQRIDEHGNYAGYVLSSDDVANITVTSPLIFRALWYVTVTFDLQGGSGSFPAQTIVQGTTASEPSAIPTREGYTFAGWFTSAGRSAWFDFSYAIMQNTTVYAHWTLNNSGGNGGNSGNGRNGTNREVVVPVVPGISVDTRPATLEGEPPIIPPDLTPTEELVILPDLDVPLGAYMDTTDDGTEISLDDPDVPLAAATRANPQTGNGGISLRTLSLLLLGILLMLAAFVVYRRRGANKTSKL